jgi:hypothetical protein
MIVVTKLGKLPEKRKLVGVCQNCECQVVCNEEDAEERIGCWAVKCPTEGCGRDIFVRIAKEPATRERYSECGAGHSDGPSSPKFASQ